VIQVVTKGVVVLVVGRI